VNLNRSYEECLRAMLALLWEMFDQDADRAQSLRATERIVLNQLGDNKPQPLEPHGAHRLVGRRH